MFSTCPGRWQLRVVGSGLLPLLTIPLSSHFCVRSGCIHATSTPDGDLPSMHMTVGLETLWDVGEDEDAESGEERYFVFLCLLISIPSFALSFRSFHNVGGVFRCWRCFET